MVIEIWSDVVCPFCYIGKRRIEKALSKFEHKDDIEIVWHSFQLHPTVKTESNKTIHEYLAAQYGITVDQIKENYGFIKDMANDVGLKFSLDNALLINTKNAHRLLQLAKKEGKDSAAEEVLFHAYFTENKNLDDLNFLESIAVQIGLSAEKFRDAINSESFDQEIDNDIYQANQIGVRGVPFFLMNNEISVIGAQSEEVFLNSIKKAWVSWNSKIKTKPNTIEGNTCSIDGTC